MELTKYQDQLLFSLEKDSTGTPQLYSCDPVRWSLLFNTCTINESGISHIYKRVRLKGLLGCTLVVCISGPGSMTKMTRLYFLPTILLVIHLVLILTSGNSTLVRRGCK